MDHAEHTARVALPLALLAGVGMAWAGSQGGVRLAGLPLFGILVGLIFLVQWLAFIPAYRLRTERYYDLTGSLTYILVTLAAVWCSPVVDARSVLLSALVVTWSGRLGIYLFSRIRKAGRDVRFDDIKGSFMRFLSAWTLQGLWVTFTLAAALAAITTPIRKAPGPFALIGALIWAAGFATEVVADAQKRRFRAQPANSGRFIHTGLWALSRHPNYFGEIVLWTGVALIALPVLRGWQWVTLLSPIFVTLLLTRISGVPLLEQHADERWGGQADYEAYKRHTPVLIPRLPRRR